MEISDLNVTQDTIYPRASTKGFHIISALETKKYQSEEKYLSVVVEANDYSKQIVKLPFTEEGNELIKKVTEAANRGEQIRVRFKNFKANIYILFNSNKAGISCSATGFEIVQGDNFEVINDIPADTKKNH